MSHAGQPPQQAATIPFRRRRGNVEVCLIRRKDSDEWGIPKGLVEPGDTREATALMEAREEAGLGGRLVGGPIGHYEYKKWGTRFSVAVYLLEVSGQDEAWPEASFRERRWVLLGAASSLLAGHPVHQLYDRASRLLSDVGGPSTKPEGPSDSRA